MARNRRQSTRTATQKSAEPSSPLSSRSNTPTKTEPAPESVPAHTEEDTCPACTPESTESFNAQVKEHWIRCDVCKAWYHWRCAGNGAAVDTIDKWYCKSCMGVNPNLAITTKAPARKSSRKRTQRDYANLNSGVQMDPKRWLRMLEGKDIKPDPFQRMEGTQVGMEWVEENTNAMTEPIVILSPDGLGMKMPKSDFTVDDVAELVGADTPLDVIDVASQSASPGWTLGKWVDYFHLEPESRDKILNVISLEVSGTKLSDKILPPRLVRELDWVENYWPSTRKGKGNVYPKVQLYCLMGVADAWTDWHIDFAGSSVYYHIVHGSKIFYFIRPTPANLNAYERWSGTELQNHSWLGDMVDEVFKVVLTEGNTMIIPTGWIHAVYTPVDTLVFGGNFLHSFNVATQLRVRAIEIATQVPRKFRFPMFTKLCWYVGDKYLRDLKSSNPGHSSREISAMLPLADFLVSEVRMLERGTDQAKKEAKEQIPLDRVKDAAAVARELRWRLKLAAGYSSDDEGAGLKVNGSINGHKRKRAISESSSAGTGEFQMFRNFKPRVWDNTEKAASSENLVLKGRRPGPDDAWQQEWVGWMDGNEVGNEADVKRRKETVVRVQKTAKGLIRQRIERVVEDWVWRDSVDAAMSEAS
ncbi:hypothetical protein BD779DRAFT_1510319 [Infundibulicybe gibba]|nr:hypothetical protein BD779DRAFT_1510319 [Infundibulicybe gibba]